MKLTKLAWTLLASAVCITGSSPAQAATEYWPVTTAALVPVTNASVEVSQSPFPNTNGLGGFATGTILYYTSDTNGLVTMTNLIPGTYTAALTDPQFQDVTSVTFTITNFNSTNFVVNNSSVATNLPASANAFSMAASVEIFLQFPALNIAAGSVPTANGMGGYSWQAQQGGGGGSTFIQGAAPISVSTNAGIVTASITGVVATNNLPPNLAALAANNGTNLANLMSTNVTIPSASGGFVPSFYAKDNITLIYTNGLNAVGDNSLLFMTENSLGSGASIGFPRTGTNALDPLTGGAPQFILSVNANGSTNYIYDLLAAQVMVVPANAAAGVLPEYFMFVQDPAQAWCIASAGSGGNMPYILGYPLPHMVTEFPLAQGYNSGKLVPGNAGYIAAARIDNQNGTLNVYSNGTFGGSLLVSNNTTLNGQINTTSANTAAFNGGQFVSRYLSGSGLDGATEYLPPGSGGSGNYNQWLFQPTGYDFLISMRNGTSGNISNFIQFEAIQTGSPQINFAPAVTVSNNLTVTGSITTPTLNATTLTCTTLNVSSGLATAVEVDGVGSYNCTSGLADIGSDMHTTLPSAGKYFITCIVEYNGATAGDRIYNVLDNATDSTTSLAYRSIAGASGNGSGNATEIVSHWVTTVTASRVISVLGLEQSGVGTIDKSTSSIIYQGPY